MMSTSSWDFYLNSCNSESLISGNSSTSCKILFVLIELASVNGDTGICWSLRRVGLSAESVGSGAPGFCYMNASYTSFYRRGMLHVLNLPVLIIKSLTAHA